METDLVRLIARFIQLNKDMLVGYVNLNEYLETYLALDLLSDREFHPIVEMLAAIGVDFFFILGVVFGLSRRLEHDQFSKLSGYLDLKDQRLILSCAEYPHLLPEFQAFADIMAARSMELRDGGEFPDDSVFSGSLN